MIIPGYEIIAKLGEGGSATVWKARQISLNRVVAIKLVADQKLENYKIIDRFRLEAESAARLNHPGIIQAYDMVEHGSFAFLVMEYVDGKSLDEILLRDKCLSPGEVIDLAAQVAEAMDYAWETARLVHCDIKPGNLLIDDTFRAKIADLGVSRILGSTSENLDRDMIIGTPYYSSPEQAAAQLLDARSDVYSLGATLYHALTGHIPFGSDDIETALLRHGTDRIPDPVDIDRTVPVNLVWLLEKMMMRDPDARQNDWKELIRDIKNLRMGQPPAGCPVDPGLSTIDRSPYRPLPKQKSILIKKKAGAKSARISSEALAASSASYSSGQRSARGRFLRPAMIQLLTVGILTAGIYTMLYTLSLREPEPEPSDSVEINRVELK